MNFIDLLSGAGGLSKGFIKADFNIFISPKNENI